MKTLILHPPRSSKTFASRLQFLRGCCEKTFLFREVSAALPQRFFLFCSYNRPRFSNDDFAKEPPGIPPHLQLTLLNAPPAMDATAALPRPQHVVLNHLYHQRATHGINAIVVGTTHRYNSKYVTSVLYKPRKRKSTIPIP